MHAVTGGGEAVSHRDLVSIIPYSSIVTTSEADDKITAHRDPRRPPPVATGNERCSSPDRHTAITELIRCLDNAEPEDSTEQPLSADEYREYSPGSGALCLAILTCLLLSLLLSSWRCKHVADVHLFTSQMVFCLHDDHHH